MSHPVAHPQPTIEMPLITFLFTMDQISAMTGISLHDLQYKYCYFVGRSTGRKPRHQFVAHNIAPDNETPEWRVSNTNWVMWLRANGFQVVYPESL